MWSLSGRADPRGAAIADRHYNRQKIGSPQFVPPGGCLVLIAPGALWVTSTPKAEYVKHRWAGAWVNSTFRNERPDLYLSSTAIIEALAATAWCLGPPPLGLVTFVDATKVRRKRDPGRCYRRAGFEHVGFTEEEELWAYQLTPEKWWPPAEAPHGAQMELAI
jgi:hypothetical protein